ncbi:MAG: response regulator [Marmoricola sp.]
MSAIRVLIVDDEAIVRDGLRLIIDLEPDLEVVGDASDGRAALAAARSLRPDVALVDIQMPTMNGIETTQAMLSAPHPPRVLILTTFDRNEHVYAAMRAGASGFLLTDVRRDQLTNAIRTVAAGDALLAPTITRRLIEDFCSAPAPGVATPDALSQLTARELEVLTLVARGQSNADIAAHLVISESTVKTHVARILMKLELHDRAQAVVAAYETGLVRPGR